jgi:putative PLP-dependent aminotransferase (TIGR04422 family)
VGGQYTLWSLPKVLGTIAGGVVFCRTESAAQRLRAVRDLRAPSVLQFGLRCWQTIYPWAARYWNGAEALQGQPPAMACNQILLALQSLPTLVENRLAALTQAFPRLAEHTRASGRIPSNLPLKPHPGLHPHWSATGRFSAGLRNFNVSLRNPACQWQPCAPLPLHRDVAAASLLAQWQVFNALGVKDELGFV